MSERDPRGCYCLYAFPHFRATGERLTPPADIHWCLDCKEIAEDGWGGPDDQQAGALTP